MESNEQEQQAEKFLAWKALAWDTNHKLLTSPQQQFDWRPRSAMQAYCGLAHDLREMQPEKCTCGIYARTQIDKELLDYVEYNNGVLAQIAMWGWIVEGPTGFRAQYAYPRVLLVGSHFTEEAQELMREKYAVPVMVNDEAFSIEEKRRQQATIDLSQFTAKQIASAVRQAKYHKWYNEKKRIEKLLRQWEATLALAPVQIASLKQQLARCMASKP